MHHDGYRQGFAVPRAAATPIEQTPFQVQSGCPILFWQPLHLRASLVTSPRQAWHNRQASEHYITNKLSVLESKPCATSYTRSSTASPFTTHANRPRSTFVGIFDYCFTFN